MAMDIAMAGLPIPQDHYGIFKVRKNETLTITSNGFTTCSGILFRGKGGDDSEILGFTHFSGFGVHETKASFEEFFSKVRDECVGQIELYQLCPSIDESITRARALSLCEFAKEKKVILAGGDFQNSADAYAITLQGGNLNFYKINSKDQNGDDIDAALTLQTEAFFAEMLDSVPDNTFAVYLGAKIQTSSAGLKGVNLIPVCDPGVGHPML